MRITRARAAGTPTNKEGNMSIHDIPSLEEEYGWMYDEDDNPPVIFDTDFDFAGETAEADELAEHNRREADCCGGRNFNCSCYGRTP
jgi:hypothetical protein